MHSLIFSSLGMLFVHCIDCWLDSGSKWWNLVSSHMTVCDRNPSPPTSYWCRSQWHLLSLFVILFSVSLNLSAWVALKERTPWNSHAFNLLPLYFLVQWIVYSIIHQLLCDGYCISVHQPGSCEASLHCRYSHSSIHHEVLLLLMFQLLLSLLPILLYLFWSVLGPEYLLSFLKTIPHAVCSASLWQ
jgi:hypothetical protein